MAQKQDSNLTGLRYAEEASLKTLPGSPVFYPLEPNSYSDFGGQLATVARTPINPSRQRKKGTITDLDASGGFNQDLTMNNLTRLLQGFFFADAREKKSTQPLNAAAVPVTSVTASSKTYAAASGLTGLLAGAVVLASGFGVSANNGVKTMASASSGTAAVVNETIADEASPPAAAKLVAVGHQFASATMNIAMNSDLVRLSRASGTFDLTTLGLIEGEWIFLGDDTAGNRFANNVGFARIAKGGIAATYLEFDKVSWTPQAETGTGKTIRIYFGTVLKNEADPALIKRRTYHIERTLGEDDDGTMSEILVGAVANELTLNVPQADKVNVDLSFVALDNQQRTGLDGLISGDRPDIAAEEALNTSSDFARIQLGLDSASDATVTPLFAFATEMTLTINNNVSANKAIGVLGGFDTSAGRFDVGGNMTVYFADVAAVQAVRNNSDVTLDFAVVKANQGLLFDVPLLGLGDGRLNVEQDQPITLPLENSAAESRFGHTLLFIQFPYLPSVAA